MPIKTKTPVYDRLAKKIGGVTFASHLEAIIALDFESQAACARKLGIGRQSLAKYLSEERIPTPALAGEMAKKLGYSPAAFIELALSDSVKKAGYKYKVKLESA